MKMNKKKGRKAMWIAILVPVGIIALIAGSVGAGFSIMKHEYGARPEMLMSTLDNPERALVVYQPSVTSASSDVAHAIAKGLNDAGYEVTLNTPGMHLSTDISGYSIVVFGSPNYGGSLAVPLTEYVKQIDDFTGKKVILFSTFGLDGSIKPELDKLAALLYGIEPYATVKYRFNEEETNNAAAYQLGVDVAGT